MGDTRTFEVLARSSAAPDVVFDLLADATSWKRWSWLPRSERECEGVDALDGVGSIRSLGPRPFASREQVVVSERPHHFAYILLTGLPVERYRADVHLTEDGDGTLIRWHAELVAKRAAAGPVLERFLRATLTSMARSLARYASTHPG